MPKLKTLTLAISTIFMVTACASTQTAVSESEPTMQPVQRVTHGSKDPQALYELGRYYQGQARYDLALRAYRDALSLKPRYLEALTGMGVVYAHLGEYDASLRLLVAAASLAPASVSASNNVGYIRWLRDEHDEALRAYQRALKLDPMNASARANLRKIMKEAANEPPVTEAQVVLGAEAGVGALTPLLQVAPQVYELRAPARGQAAGIEPASVPSTALKEVAPQVYELRARAHVAGTVSQTGSVQQAAADAPARLVVVNGNGVKGIARQVSRHLTEQGYSSAGVRNHVHFREPRSRIEYRVGHAEPARRLGELLPRQLVLSEVPRLEDGVDIRLVLGRDIGQQLEAWNAVDANRAGTKNRLPLKIANGNGVKGIARKVAAYLSQSGYRAAAVYDSRPFNKPETRIEYRKGYEAQARKLQSVLPGNAVLMESDTSGGEVRLVLGRDLKNNAWSSWLERVRVAEAPGTKPLN